MTNKIALKPLHSFPLHYSDKERVELQIADFVVQIEKNDPTITILDLSDITNLPVEQVVEALKNNYYINEIILSGSIDKDSRKYVSLLDSIRKLEALRIIIKNFSYSYAEKFKETLKNMLSSLKPETHIREIGITVDAEEDILTSILTAIDPQKLKIETLTLYLQPNLGSHALDELKRLLDDGSIKNLAIEGGFPELSSSKTNSLRSLSFVYMTNREDEQDGSAKNLVNYLSNCNKLRELTLDMRNEFRGGHEEYFPTKDPQLYKEFLSWLSVSKISHLDLGFFELLEIETFLKALNSFGKNLQSFRISLQKIDHDLAELFIKELNQDIIEEIVIKSCERKFCEHQAYTYLKPEEWALQKVITEAVYNANKDSEVDDGFSKGLKKSLQKDASIRQLFHAGESERFMAKYVKEESDLKIIDQKIATELELLAKQPNKELLNFLKNAVKLETFIFDPFDLNINSYLIKEIIKALSYGHMLKEISFNRYYHPELLFRIDSLTTLALDVIPKKSFNSLINKIAMHPSIQQFSLSDRCIYPWDYKLHSLSKNQMQMLEGNPRILKLSPFNTVIGDEAARLRTFGDFTPIDTGLNRILDSHKAIFNVAVQKLKYVKTLLLRDVIDVSQDDEGRQYIENEEFELLLALSNYLPLFLRAKLDFLMAERIRQYFCLLEKNDGFLVALSERLLLDLPSEVHPEVIKYFSYHDFQLLIKLFKEKYKVQIENKEKVIENDIVERAAIESKEQEDGDSIVNCVYEVNHNVASFINPYELLRMPPYIFEMIKSMPEWMLQELESKAKQQGLEEAINELLGNEKAKIANDDTVNVVISALKANNISNIEEIVSDYFANTIPKWIDIGPEHRDRLFLEYVAFRTGRDILLRDTFQVENQEAETYDSLIEASYGNNAAPLVIDCKNVDIDYLIGSAGPAITVHEDETLSIPIEDHSFLQGQNQTSFEVSWSNNSVVNGVDVIRPTIILDLYSSASFAA